MIEKALSMVSGTWRLAWLGARSRGGHGDNREQANAATNAKHEPLTLYRSNKMTGS